MPWHRCRWVDPHAAATLARARSRPCAMPFTVPLGRLHQRSGLDPCCFLGQDARERMCPGHLRFRLENQAPNPQST